MVNFTAAAANSTCTNGSCSTVITFAFRDDPAQISFTNASVTDVTIPTTPSPNLLTNGSFGTGDLTGWTYVDSFGVSGAGLVGYSGEYIDNCPSFNGVVSYCWIDGAVQAYDALSQTIATTGGHTYQISFDVAENSGLIASAGAGGYPEGYPEALAILHSVVRRLARFRRYVTFPTSAQITTSLTPEATESTLPPTLCRRCRSRPNRCR